MEQTKDFLNVKEAYQWYISSPMKVKDKLSIINQTSSLDEIEKFKFSTMILAHSFFQWCIIVLLSSLYIKISLGLLSSVFAIGVALTFTQVLSVVTATLLILGVIRSIFYWITR